MSYATTLASVFGKRPIWLYEFTRGAETARFTSAAEDYTDSDSVVWTSAAVSHTRFRRTGAIERASTDIIFPQSNSWAQVYRDDRGYEDNSVTIYHEFKDKSPRERVIKYRGRVIATKPMLTRLILVAENRFTELRRKGLSAVIQKPCRHALYHSKDGYGCNLNLTDWQVEGTLTAYSNKVATVSEAASQPDGYYSGGILEYDSKKQFIVRHSGSSLTLLAPVPGLLDDLTLYGSLPVDIAPGCTLTREVCNDRFGNLANFGGFPWADETPYDGKTIF